MNAPESLKAFQLSFGGYLRNPNQSRRDKWIPARQGQIYTQLLFNNIRTFLDSCFPISQQILGEKAWLRLCRSFFRDWRCHTPIFSEIPLEFVTYLQQTEIKQALPKWFLEFAHYAPIGLNELANQTLRAITIPV